MTNDLRPIIIAVVCIVASALISSIFIYSRFHNQEKVITNTYTTTITTSPTIIPVSPTLGVSVAPSRSMNNPTLQPESTADVNEAIKILTEFNGNLNDGEYIKAAGIFDWDSIKDPSTVFGADYVVGDNSKTLANVCKNPNHCLRFYKILKTKKETNGDYTFTIQYKTKDGQIFVNSAQVSGSFINDTDFLYSVTKKGGAFKVATPPNWFTTAAE